MFFDPDKVGVSLVKLFVIEFLMLGAIVSALKIF
jgi:hypothetical protein